MTQSYWFQQFDFYLFLRLCLMLAYHQTKCSSYYQPLFRLNGLQPSFSRPMKLFSEGFSSTCSKHPPFRMVHLNSINYPFSRGLIDHPRWVPIPHHFLPGVCLIIHGRHLSIITHPGPSLTIHGGYSSSITAHHGACLTTHGIATRKVVLLISPSSWECNIHGDSYCVSSLLTSSPPSTVLWTTCPRQGRMEENG